MQDLIAFYNNFNQYFPRLGKRANTFNMMFEYLDNLAKEKYLIVETGSIRFPDNVEGDGVSTILFDLYCQHQNGTLYTVDINPEASRIARQMTSPNTIVTLNDSVMFLSKFPLKNEIDLLYLDSFDFDVANPHPSSLHHMKELVAVYSELKPGCLIVVDDNMDGKGKGEYVAEFLRNVGAEMYFNEYQIGYIKR